MSELHLNILENSLIVVAHPDDEVLWFSSIVKKVDEIIFCFGDDGGNLRPSMEERRQAVVSDYPRSSVSTLNITESSSFGHGNWPAAVTNKYGIEFFTSSKKRALIEKIRFFTPFKSQSMRLLAEKNYKRNFDLLYSELDKKVNNGMNIFTHNPWGEYGHEEHVQVFNVLDQLRKEKNFRLWVTNYCGKQALPLAANYLNDLKAKPLVLPTDKVFAREVIELYKQQDCWTWYSDWDWVDHDVIFEAPVRKDTFAMQNVNLAPLNLML